MIFDSQIQSAYNLSIRKLVMQLLPLSITISNHSLNHINQILQDVNSHLTDKDVTIKIVSIDTTGRQAYYNAEVYDNNMIQIGSSEYKIKTYELPILLRESYKINEINYRGN